MYQMIDVAHMDTELKSPQPVATTRSAKPAGSVNTEVQTLELAGDAGPIICDRWVARRAAGAAPVLLVHGWGGSGTYWQTTAAALAESVDVIVPDLPGSGRSMPVSRAQNLRNLVSALRHVVDALAIERVQVVGHSMGAAVSILLATAEAARVERLALVSMSFFTSWVQHQIYSAVMSAFSLGMVYRPDWLADVPYVPQLAAKRYFYRVPDDPALLRQGMLDFLRMDRGTAVACADDASSSAIPEAGAQLDVPTLLIACRQDLVMPVGNVEFTVNTIPGCQVRWIEECGHLPMVEKHDEFLSILTEFLDLS